MNSYKVKRNFDDLLTENCPVNIGVKIGSFDCTATCKHNQNTKKEIHDGGLLTPFIRCSERSKLKTEDKQLTIKI